VIESKNVFYRKRANICYALIFDHILGLAEKRSKFTTVAHLAICISKKIHINAYRAK